MISKMQLYLQLRWAKNATKELWDRMLAQETAQMFRVADLWNEGDSV
jgi:hypothetical protein